MTVQDWGDMDQVVVDEEQLYTLLVRVALREVHRRRSAVTGSELDDLAHQAAADALLAIRAKLPTFRGESRLTTWAYKFVILEVSNKLGRHYWHDPAAPLAEEDWSLVPDRFGVDPCERAEAAEMIAAVRRAVEETLTPWQRQLFVAVVLDNVPLDALVERNGVSRNAIYKAVFDARRKIRAFLVANGYLQDEPAGRS